MSNVLGIIINNGVSSGAANNKIKTIDFGTATFGEELDKAAVANSINNLTAPEESNYLEIAADEIVRFCGLVVPHSSSFSRNLNYYHLEGKGKGTYGQNGNITVNADDLLLYRQVNLNTITIIELEDMFNSPNSQVINLGEIANANLLNLLNATNPPYEFEQEYSYFFELTRDSKRYVYRFIGPAGEYGQNENSFTNANLLLLYAEGQDLEAPETFTSTQGQTEINLLTTPLNTDLIIDRVPLIQGIDYTLNNNTITLLDPLDAGSHIFVRKFN